MTHVVWWKRAYLTSTIESTVALASVNLYSHILFHRPFCSNRQVFCWPTMAITFFKSYCWSSLASNPQETQGVSYFSPKSSFDGQKFLPLAPLPTLPTPSFRRPELSEATMLGVRADELRPHVRPLDHTLANAWRSGDLLRKKDTFFVLF